MKISGFTFVRNAGKFFYPVKASILSILPIVDEFVVALGDCDEDDNTEEEILSIQSEKIKIIRTTWDLNTFKKGTIYAQQTDVAKNACTGDWLFYLQCDEVVHEKYLPEIISSCRKYLNDPAIEGLLFDYKHFWGDFQHYMISRAWYLKEIRIIRNDKNVHSWRDAQSFRRIQNFDGLDYNNKAGTEKLKVAKINACIHHYGFVRPPHVMLRKSKNKASHYHGTKWVTNRFKGSGNEFHYGNMDILYKYTDSQPRSLSEWIKKFNWEDKLLKQNRPRLHKLHKHERLKYQLITFVEQRLLGGEQLGGFKNYRIVNR